MNQLKEFYSFVLCGDSISKGIIFDEERQRYVTIENNFASMIQNRINGVIYNCAQFGNTILRGISKFKKDFYKNIQDIDIALIEFGGNDCDFDWEEIANDPLANHKPKTDISCFRSMLYNFIEHLKSLDIVPVLLTIPPIDADRYLEWVSKSNSEIKSQIMKWLDSVTKIYWWQERYNSVIINVAEESQARWIDIREAFLRTPDYREFLCKDGIHPSKKGHELIASKILEYINAKCDYLLLDS